MHACMHASMTQKITSNLQDSTPASIPSLKQLRLSSFKSARIESITRGACTKRLFLSFSSNASSSKKPLKEEPQNESISHRMETPQEEFTEKKNLHQIKHILFASLHERSRKSCHGNDMVHMRRKRDRLCRDRVVRRSVKRSVQRCWRTQRTI